MLDQITSDRESKCLWSKCVLCIPYILSGNPNECWIHTCTCDTCVITTWRLGLRAPLVTYFAKFLSAPRQNRESSFVDCCTLILGSRFSIPARLIKPERPLFTIDYKGFCFECNLLSTLDTWLPRESDSVSSSFSNLLTPLTSAFDSCKKFLK